MKGIAWACFIKIKRRRNLFHSPPLLRSPKRRGLPPWRKLACFQAVAAGGPSGPDGSESFTQALPGFAGGFQVRPPAKLGACVSPERVYCRQASQEALNTLSPASPAPPPVNGLYYMLYPFSIEYHLASLETDSESLLLYPAQPRVVVSLKQKNEKRHGFAMPFFALYHRARRGAESHFCPQPQRGQPASTRQESRPVTVKAVPLISAPSRKARI